MYANIPPTVVRNTGMQPTMGLSLAGVGNLVLVAAYWQIERT